MKQKFYILPVLYSFLIIRTVSQASHMALFFYFMDKVSFYYVADLGHSKLEACQEIQIRNRPLYTVSQGY